LAAFFTLRRGSHEHIDKQRIAAVRKLEQLGYMFAAYDWMHSANDAAAMAPTITDELHAMLVKRADDLEGCHAGSDEERELAAITDAIEAYEAVRWPLGRSGWWSFGVREARAFDRRGHK